MTQERLIIAQELTVERDRSSNLEQTVRLLREQSEIYQKQMVEFTSGAGKNSKSFQHFDTQIDKLTTQMGSLEIETAQWREKSEVRQGQNRDNIIYPPFLSNRSAQNK
jgi:chromosome segregation ATPase